MTIVQFNRLRPELRDAVTRYLNQRTTKTAISTADAIRSVRVQFPNDRLNDAELTSLIAEGAIRRGLAVDFDGWMR
jgi:hypothetical protein